MEPEASKGGIDDGGIRVVDTATPRQPDCLGAHYEETEVDSAQHHHDDEEDEEGGLGVDASTHEANEHAKEEDHRAVQQVEPVTAG